MQRTKEPLSVAKTIELANSLIKDTKYSEKLVEWKSKLYGDLPNHCKQNVGYGWYHGFFKRYKHLLTTKHGERYASNRAEWSKKIYFEQMYSKIYENMIHAGIAEKFEKETYLDRNNQPVDDDSPLKFGDKTDVNILFPEYILFFDETGCNTSQKKDGHVGGEKFLVERGTTPKIHSSTRDQHFTVLGVTNARGDPILAVVIFASERKNGCPSNWYWGIDCTVTDPKMTPDGADVSLDDCNFGPGNYFPGGPVCKFNGKELKTLVMQSPSGGITGEQLV